MTKVYYEDELYDFLVSIYSYFEGDGTKDIIANGRSKSAVITPDNYAMVFLMELNAQGSWVPVGFEIYDDDEWEVSEPGEYDEVGGYHEAGTGTSPDGYECGECSKRSCENCPAYLDEIKEKGYE